MLVSFFNVQLTAIWLLACIFWCNGSTTTTPATTVLRQNVASGRPRNDHDEIKSLINHVVDGVLQKIDVNHAIYMNELSTTADVIIGSFSRSVRGLNARMQTLEMLSHQIDELTDYKNTVDTKLFRLSENTEAEQMLNVRLNDLQQKIDYVRSRMDRFNEKMFQQPNGSNKVNAAVVDSEMETTLASGEQNAANCESKIDQVISFVHNFAEINRLESTDILNRLGNMQTQLIHFFDADKVNAKSHNHPNSREKIYRNKTDSSDEHTNATTDVLQSNVTSSTDQLLNDVKKFSDGELQNEKNVTIEELDQSKNASRVERSILDRPHLPSAHRSANYGVPTRFGCHGTDSTVHSDGFYRFEAIPPNRNPANRKFNERMCLFEEHGTSWTVIQRRGQQYQSNGPENFNRTWNDYKYGFGDLSGGEFWYGNDFIHLLTYEDDMELKIILENWAGQRIEFNYDIFRVDAEKFKYNLNVDGFRGDNKTLDAMAYHNRQDFSTFDRQNDRTGIDGNRDCCSCAISYASGWWFNNCLEANVNGVYQTQPLNNNFVGIIWEHWLGDYSLKSTQMMIRPKIEWTNDVDENETNPNSRPPDDP